MVGKEGEGEGKVDEGESGCKINSKSTNGCANRKWRTERILSSSPRRQDTGESNKILKNRRCEVEEIRWRGSQTLESNSER